MRLLHNRRGVTRRIRFRDFTLLWLIIRSRVPEGGQVQTIISTVLHQLARSRDSSISTVIYDDRLEFSHASCHIILMWIGYKIHRGNQEEGIYWNNNRGRCFVDYKVKYNLFSNIIDEKIMFPQSMIDLKKIYIPFIHPPIIKKYTCVCWLLKGIEEKYILKKAKTRYSICRKVVFLFFSPPLIEKKFEERRGWHNRNFTGLVCYWSNKLTHSLFHNESLASGCILTFLNHCTNITNFRWGFHSNVF